MTRRSRIWLVALSLLVLVDLGFTVHTALTWKAQPTGPSVMPAGELLGWVSSAILLAWIALIVIGAVRPARQRGWTDPTRQDRMAPHKPVNINRTTPR